MIQQPLQNYKFSPPSNVAEFIDVEIITWGL